MIRGAQDLPDRPLIVAKTDQFPSGRIAVRPPIGYLARDKLQRAIDAVIHVGENVVDRLYLL